MRIIGGVAKGRQLLYPHRLRARPTTDRIKESLFNILGQLENQTFLDIYAGAGNVGIEALSRGAAFAAFIEKDATLAQYTQNNLLRCGFTGKYQILGTTMQKAVSLLHNQGKLFNIIFADPPYEETLVCETLGKLVQFKLSAPDGLVIFQHSTREMEGLDGTKDFVLIDQRKYGDTLLSFLKPQ